MLCRVIIIFISVIVVIIINYLIFAYFQHFDALTARMSKITNDGLTQSGTGCFIAVHIWQLWVSKG